MINITKNTVSILIRITVTPYKCAVYELPLEAESIWIEDGFFADPGTRVWGIVKVAKEKVEQVYAEYLGDEKFLPVL